MNTRSIGLAFLCAVAVAGCKDHRPGDTATGQTAPAQPPRPPPSFEQPSSTISKEQIMSTSGIPQGSGDLYAIFHTSRGNIVVKLFEKDAPITVANFVGLATGSREWTDPRTHAKTKARLYDGTVFHRVIPQFMIQGGDPLGTGTGDPGYRFEDEFGSGKKFDKPGLLAMANAGPGTNGSQFFITEVPTPHLNNKHTIFGEVTKGFELVPQIGRAGNGTTKLDSLEIVRSEKAP
jgi:peptidyl-prolyl cis-trans isomerase A (cyclophilin A)